MGTLTLYPDANHNPVNPANVVLTGGATIQAVLASGDADYVSENSTGGYNVYLGFPTPALPTGAKISSLQAQLRSRRTDIDAQWYLDVIAYRDPGTGAYTPSVALGKPGYAADSVIREWASAFITTAASGATWSSLDADGSDLVIRLYVEIFFTTDSGTRAYAVRLIVTYNDAPVVSAILPSGNVGVSRPALSWTYADAESDAKQKHQVRIFSAAQYGAGGFDPDITVPIWDSGLVVTANNTQTVGADLVNATTYKAYVKVWQTQVNGEDHTSLWTAGPAFTISLDPPAQPTLVATADTPNARIALDVQGRDNMLTANQSSIETDLTGWAVVAGSFASIARVTSLANHGVASMALTKNTGTGDSFLTTPTGVAGFPVTVGETYTALASFRLVTGAPRSCRVEIGWYTAAGALISTSLGNAGNDSNSVWTQLLCTAVAPATAAFACAQLKFTAVPNGEVHNVDTISFAPGNSTVWTIGGFVGTQYVTIERSLDGGAVWAEMRGATYAGLLALSTPSQAVTVYDYEVPTGLAAQYRAKIRGTASGSSVSGALSAVASATQTSSVWWLKDPLDPTRNLVVSVVPGFQIEYPKPNETDYPIGQTVAAVSHEGVKGAVISSGIRTLSLSVYTALMLLLQSGRTLLLQDVLGRQWYVQPDNGISFEMMLASSQPAEAFPVRHAHECQVTLVEVGAP